MHGRRTHHAPTIISLCPFRKSVGTFPLNKYSKYGEKRVGGGRQFLTLFRGTLSRFYFTRILCFDVFYYIP